VRFVPEQTSVGQAPIGIVEQSNDLLLTFIGQQFSGVSAVDWLPSALEELDSIEIVDEQLVLNRRVEG
jgi:hypothetical protein